MGGGGIGLVVGTFKRKGASELLKEELAENRDQKTVGFQTDSKLKSHLA